MPELIKVVIQRENQEMSQLQASLMLNQEVEINWKQLLLMDQFQ